MCRRPPASRDAPRLGGEPTVPRARGRFNKLDDFESDSTNLLLLVDSRVGPPRGPVPGEPGHEPSVLLGVVEAGADLLPPHPLRVEDDDRARGVAEDVQDVPDPAALEELGKAVAGVIVAPPFAAEGQEFDLQAGDVLGDLRSRARGAASPAVHRPSSAASSRSRSRRTPCRPSSVASAASTSGPGGS